MYEILTSITTDKLHIDKIKHHFKGKPVLKHRKSLHLLIGVNGCFVKIGRGKFTLGEGKTYIPEISPSTKSIYRKLKTEFPYINLCVWNTSALNESNQLMIKVYYF